MQKSYVIWPAARSPLVSNDALTLMFMSSLGSSTSLGWQMVVSFGRSTTAAPDDLLNLALLLLVSVYIITFARVRNAGLQNGNAHLTLFSILWTENIW